MDQPTSTPTRKVTVGLLGGAVGIIIVWLVKQFANIEIPAEVGMALQTVGVFALQYIVPNAEV